MNCGSSWLSKSMQLELPKPLYHFNRSTSSSCLHQRSSPKWLVNTPQHIIHWNHWPQLNRAKNSTAVNVDYQSQCSWNCQNLCITPIARLTLPVSISVPVPRDSSICHHPSHIETINHIKVGSKQHCSSCWFSKSMQLEQQKPLYQSYCKTSSSWLHQPFGLLSLVHTPQPITI
jgi:hypothetical protein